MRADEAQRQKRSVDALRKELSNVAGMAVPAMVGPPNGKAVSNALIKFIGKPGRLVLDAKSKDPQGLGVADLAMAAGNPLELVRQVDIEATAD